MSVWLLIAAMVLATLATRFPMLELSNRVRLPLWLLRSLRFVPPALLTAIAVPGILYRAGALDISILNERLLAGLVAALIAWRTRNAIYTVLGGMAVAWIVTALRG